ncbi:MAG: hypothetical protein LBU12_02900 [Deltaproteobacteria bacterium]|jgi:uncharacterized membrane protein|nr:hypothetical protein [Deltaproteobacteria bacterium]
MADLSKSQSASSEQPSTSPSPVIVPHFDDDDIKANKLVAALAYLGILFIIPLLVAPNSKFARAHTNQGILLYISYLLASLIFMFLYMLPLINILASVFGFLFFIVLFIINIRQIILVLTSKYKPIPIIGNIPILSNL